MSVALAGHRRDDPHLDIFDEGAHYAYVVALRSGHLPAWGDTVTLQEREMADCLLSAARPPARCGSRPAPPSLYPAAGYDYEAQQPPLGYLPYVLTANPQASPDAAIADARRGGIIWIGVSAVLLLVLGVVEDFSLLALGALLCTCLLNPVFTYATATVNNDAAGVAAGTVAVIAWSWSKRRPQWSLWLGATSGVLIGLTKGQYVAVPLAFVIAAVVQEGRHVVTRQDIKEVLRRHLCVLTMLIATVVVFGAFTYLQDVRAIVPPSTVLNALEGFSRVATLQPSTLSQGIANGLTLFQPYYAFDAFNVVWGVCVFGALAGFWFFQIPEEVARRVRGLSLGILVGIFGVALGSTLFIFLQGHYNLPWSTRFEICMLPLIGYVIIRGCRRFGVITIGIVLPVLCAIVQLAAGKY